MPPNPSEASEWLFYASEDIAYGRLGMVDLPRAASWSFQQATEKAIKALWLAYRTDAPRTHDIVFLLSGLDEDLCPPPAVRDAVLRLAEITPAIRYPGDDLPAVSREDADDYASAADTVYEWAKLIIGKINE